jgi:hypothetical protein
MTFPMVKLDQKDIQRLAGLIGCFDHVEFNHDGHPVFKLAYEHLLFGTIEISYLRGEVMLFGGNRQLIRFLPDLFCTKKFLIQQADEQLAKMVKESTDTSH